jgi:hypothetical protein
MNGQACRWAAELLQASLNPSQVDAESLFGSRGFQAD